MVSTAGDRNGKRSMWVLSQKYRQLYRPKKFCESRHNASKLKIESPATSLHSINTSNTCAQSLFSQIAHALHAVNKSSVEKQCGLVDYDYIALCAGGIVVQTVSVIPNHFVMCPDRGRRCCKVPKPVPVRKEILVGSRNDWMS